MARQAFLASRANASLSVVMLFLMGAASHYPMFGKQRREHPGAKNSGGQNLASRRHFVPIPVLEAELNRHVQVAGVLMVQRLAVKAVEGHIAAGTSCTSNALHERLVVVP
jgi:hypothetical protein